MLSIAANRNNPEQRSRSSDGIFADRRRQHNPLAIPNQGCRRASDRAQLGSARPWFLQANYAEEIG